ncbi:MAG: hypothetical protein KC502_03975 [Myxococcales bacterium]|nr:hypothetical protein [Myxococcales bacterium]
MPKKIAILVLVGFVLGAVPAYAGAPSTLLYEGALTTATGAAAPSGNYNITFKLYATEAGQTPFYTEAAKVAVAGGRLSHTLGASTALNLQTLAGASQVWVGVTVGNNKEQKRRQLHSVAYALHAKQAELALGLACTGCVKASSLKWDSNIDLAGNSIKAQQLTAKNVTSQTVVAQEFIGDGSKLTGIKTPAGSCPSGQFVTGIDQGGNLVCKASGVSGGALAQVSNGALSNEFSEVFNAPTKNIPIPDNTGLDALSTIKMPSVGTAQKLTLKIELTNSDLSNLSIVLLPPNDKKVGYVVCDPCGPNDSVKTFSKSYSAKLHKGDLSVWAGKNPQGFWNLKVKDTALCAINKQGNQALCDAKKSTDGLLKNWSLSVNTVSNTDVLVAGTLVAQGGVQVGATSAPCTAKRKGALRYLDGDGLQVCNGTSWSSAVGSKVIHFLGTCTSSGSSSTRTFCLNKTLANTASAYLTVSKTNSGSATDFNTGRVVFKKKGYYRVTFNQRSRGSMQAWMYKNGSQIQYFYHQNYSSYYGSMSHSRIIWFDVNNYFNIKFYSNYNAWYANDTTLEVEFLGL